MSDQCKYCGTDDLEWKQTLEGRWTLIAPDGYRHHCRNRPWHSREQVEAPKPRKGKHGAFLRLYGPRAARTHAVLVETRIDPDTPAGMYLETER